MQMGSKRRNWHAQGQQKQNRTCKWAATGVTNVKAVALSQLGLPSELLEAEP